MTFLLLLATVSGCRTRDPEEVFNPQLRSPTAGRPSADADDVSESDDDAADDDAADDDAADDDAADDDAADDSERDEPSSHTPDASLDDKANKGSSNSQDAGQSTLEPDTSDDDAADDNSRESDAGADPDRVDDGAFPLPIEQDLLAICGSAPSGSATFTRRALRAAAADCATWHYCRFEPVASALQARLQAHQTVPNDTSLAAAQESFRQAMLSWSTVELFQFGPLGSRAQSANKDPYEGQGIRDLIYAWPSTSACRVQEQLVGQSYEKGFDGALISGRGLFAIEYALFAPSTASDCAAGGASASGWASLSADTIAERKRDYAVAVASDILKNVKRLRALWAPEGGNFRQTLMEATGAYPSDQETLNVIAWSLVYVEREVKDWKLGIPAGYTLTHPVTTAETPFAQLGLEAVDANLRGFRALFQGCGDSGEGLGFDDWLNAVGHEALAEDMVQALNSALSATGSSPPLHTATTQQLDEVYSSVRSLTTLLKTEFFGAGSPLNLELPGSVEGDTD